MRKILKTKKTAYEKYKVYNPLDTNKIKEEDKIYISREEDEDKEKKMKKKKLIKNLWRILKIY